MKPTKRKAFNFLRSYFDVLNELKEDSDKLDFLLSIINKQFTDEDPKGLNFIVNLCYESQRHSIDSSVKGWKRASKTTLQGDPLTTPPTNPPTPKGLNPKEEEEKGEEKEEKNIPPTPSSNNYSFDKSQETPSKEEINDFDVKYTEIKLIEDWSKCRNHFLKQPTGIKKLNSYEKTYFSQALKTYSVEEIKEAMKCHFMQENKTIKSMYLRPSHFLEHIDKYHTAAIAKEFQLYGSNKVKPSL